MKFLILLLALSLVACTVTKDEGDVPYDFQGQENPPDQDNTTIDSTEDSGVDDTFSDEKVEPPVIPT